ncbi:Protein kinase-like domain protein [Moelleriella libera RCEF 2490]|uniref:EKC/KEOPS complex subunit BUD32 n=1 Tax=Moelleriella libera RCEF 2490 TaxID=1081109 RepID=A0A166UV27_9HYPO|nr:Protein kinase-like domain protein [Moelleriella libera RCEF 2490]
MELSEQTIRDVIHPTAAFRIDDSSPNSGGTETARQQVPWEVSNLNPKNRINALVPPQNPMWRIDGSTGFGAQYYAVPLFLHEIPPIRVDVFIPEPSSLPEDVREDLDLDATFYTRDGTRISRLGITSHILRVLQHWILTQPDPTKIYEGLPFGSRIVFHNLPKDIAATSITLAPTHHLERQLLSKASLQQFWGQNVDLPPVVDINDITYVSQLHDSVCLVRIEGTTWIFKALTSYTKYLYHELRQLLTTAPHSNIVSRPAHLVTKKCSFGNKTAVVGFTLEHHIHGSLRDLIPFMQLHGQVSLAEKTKWCCQVTAAVSHLHHVAHMFYPDLRMDNIVLSESRDAIMVDFEQRGVWCEFAAPEVNAVEYMRLLATDDDLEDSVQGEYATLLTEMLPGWNDMGPGEEYIWPSKGYNVAWMCLTRTEQEACEVYMLGRVLWCIFEASSAPQRAAVWLSYPWEPQVEFPGYTITPEPMRKLIDACTRGRQAGLSKHIVRKQKKLVMRNQEQLGTSTVEEIQQTATEWWRREISFSANWLRERTRGIQAGTWNENFYNRPSLEQVLESLKDFQQNISPV